MYVPLYIKDVICGDCTRRCKHGLSMLHIHQRHPQSFNVSILHVIEHVSTMIFFDRLLKGSALDSAVYAQP